MRCASREEIPHCAAVDQNGCTACDAGFFVESATVCSACAAWCLSCQDAETCDACNDTAVLSNGKCLGADALDGCRRVEGGVCVECVDGMEPTVNGACEASPTRVIVIVVCVVVACCVAIVLVACVVCAVVFFPCMRPKQEATVFKMSRSNVVFVREKDSLIAVNRKELTFTDFGNGDAVMVGAENRDVLCVGNVSKHAVKVRVVLHESDVYDTSVTPNSAVLKRGMACEFAFVITPHCSSVFTDRVVVEGVDLKTNGTSHCTVTFDVKTESSTWILNNDVMWEMWVGRAISGSSPRERM